MSYPPTRQSLLILKGKVKVASKSHKLLEDKRNSLIKRFLEVIDEAVKARAEFEENYQKSYKLMRESRQISDKSYYDLLPEFSDSILEISTDEKSVLSVKLTKLKLVRQQFKLNYSQIATNKLLDESLKYLKKAIKPLIKTLELEYTARKLSEEIIKTRRRVNSLEHVIIPDMNKSIKDISFKLSELEQATKVTLMRVKANMS